MYVRRIGVLSQTQGSAFPSTNLVSYWRLDENSGTSAADAKGSNTGTLSAASWVTGKNGSGFSTTSGRWIGFGTGILFKGTDPWSVSMWYRITSLSNGFFVLMSNLDASVNDAWIDFYGNSTSRNLYLTMFHDNGNRLANYPSAACPNDTNWHHVVATYNGTPSTTCMEIFVDNVSKGNTTSNSWNNPTHALGSTLMVGKRATFTYDPVEVDEIAVFNAKISNADIAAIYNSGTGLFY